MEVIGTRNRGLQRLNKVMHNGVIKTVDCISPGFVSLVEDVDGDKFGPWVDLDEIEFIRLDKSHLKSIEGSFYEVDTRSNTCFGVWLKEGCVWVLLEYLHQLQNMHHLFTGETLEL